MQVTIDERMEDLLPAVGAAALVVYLIVFDQSFDLVAAAPISGPANDLAGGGLLALSLLCFAGWALLFFRN